MVPLTYSYLPVFERHSYEDDRRTLDVVRLFGFDVYAAGAIASAANLPQSFRIWLWHIRGFCSFLLVGHGEK
jgi:hypothetical protein